MKKIKLLTMILFLFNSISVFANPFRAMEIALKIQDRVDQIDHERTLEALDNVNDALESLNSSMASKSTDNIIITDLVPSECEEVDIESITCFEEEFVDTEDNYCQVDEEHYSSISK